MYNTTTSPSNLTNAPAAASPSAGPSPLRIKAMAPLGSGVENVKVSSELSSSFGSNYSGGSSPSRLRHYNSPLVPELAASHGVPVSSNETSLSSLDLPVEEIVSRMKTAVGVLHDPLSSGASRADANAWLHCLGSDATGDGKDSELAVSSPQQQRRKKLPTRDVLAACVSLLRGDENVGFFVANVMYSKIRREWGALEDNERSYLRARVDAEVKMEVEGRVSPDGDMHIRTLQRLCLCTAAMSVLARGDSANARTITETVKEAEWMLSAVKAVMSGGGDPSKPLIVFTELLVMLPEEYEHNLEVLSAERQTELREEFQEVAPITMQLVRQMLVAAGSTSTEVACRGLKCIGKWAGVGGITLPKTLEGDGDSILSILLSAFSASVASLTPELLVASSNALASVLSVQQYPTWYGSSPAAAQAFDLCLKAVIKSWPILEHCAANPYETEEVAHALCKVAVALGEYQTENARFPFGDDDDDDANGATPSPPEHFDHINLQLVQYILKCAAFPLRLVARTTIEFWLSLQDIPMDKRHPTIRQPLYAELLMLMLRQCCLESNTDSLEDVDYDLESFRNSSDGVRDLLVSAWYVLKRSYFETLIQTLNDVQTNSGASHPETTWPTLESVFFLMHAVSRDVKAYLIENADTSTTPRAATTTCPAEVAENDTPLALRPQQRCLYNLITQLATQAGSGLLASHPLVAAAAAKFVGSYASVLSHIGHGNDERRELVKSALCVLVPALLLPNISAQSTAAKSISALCSACASYIAGIPDVMPQMLSKLHEASVMASHPLPIEQRKQVTEGITRVIIKVKSSRARDELLAALVNPVIQRGMQSLSSGAIYKDQAAANMVAGDLKVLKTVAMFLQKSSSLQVYLNATWPFLEAVGQTTVNQPRLEVVDALFGLFGSLFVSAKNLLLPRLSGVLTAAVNMYQSLGARASSCLDCIAKSVEVYARSHEEFKQSFREMFDLVSQFTFKVASTSSVIRDHPETLQAYFDMTYRYFLFCPDALFASSSFPNVIRLAIASCNNQERSSIRSVLSFLTELLARNAGAWAPFADTTSAVFLSGSDPQVKHVTRQLISGLAFAAPSLLIAHLGRALHALVSRFPSQFQQCAVEFLSSADFEPRSLPPATRRGFIEAAMRLADEKGRFRSMVLDFAKICRGEMTHDAMGAYSL